MSIKEIWSALDNGKSVKWSNDNYMVHAIPYDRGENDASKLSLRDGQALRVTCESNYFGSLITERDLAECYIK